MKVTSFSELRLSSDSLMNLREKLFTSIKSTSILHEGEEGDGCCDEFLCYSKLYQDYFEEEFDLQEELEKCIHEHI